MNIAIEQLNSWLDSKEDEHLEFKEAKTSFHFEKLVKYCAALANEGGGSMVLGVTSSVPRRVVGSQAFSDLERTKSGLIEKLHLRIEAVSINHPDGRVVVFTAPARPIGVPIAVDGAYWMRASEALTPMTPDMLRRVFEETESDFPGEVCSKARLTDLAPEAIVALRERWHRRSKNDMLVQASDAQLLRDAELVTDEGVTYSATTNSIIRTGCSCWTLRPSTRPLSARAS